LFVVALGLGLFHRNHKKCLEYGHCILGLSSVDEERDKEEGDWNDFCGCGGAVTIGDQENYHVDGVSVHDGLEIWAEPSLGVGKVGWCEFDECREFRCWVGVIAEGQGVAFVGVLCAKGYPKPRLDAM